jgi:hypothetical protein
MLSILFCVNELWGEMRSSGDFAVYVFKERVERTPEEVALPLAHYA